MEIILHITDLHFGYEGSNSGAKAKRQNCLESLLNEISVLDTQWKPSIICITGDLVWRGVAGDFNEAKVWLDKLLQKCNLKYSKVICCPGNHEVDRSKAKKISRPSKASEADDCLEYPIADHYLEPFAEYIKFCEKTGVSTLELGKTESSLVGTCTINGVRFVVLNSAWFSKDNKDKDKLWLGLPHLELMQSNQQISVLQNTEDAPITVALMHHPSDWLHPEEQASFSSRKNTKDYLATRCHILLTGHTHGEVRDPDRIANGAHHFSGGATYAEPNYHNNFRLIRIEDECLVYKSFEYDPRSPTDKWNSSDAKTLEINTKPQSKLSLKKTENLVTNIEICNSLKVYALSQRNQKSRLLRPTGILPKDIENPVSVRVSTQQESFDTSGQLIRPKDSEQIISMFEAIRKSRNTLLLGDLGTGKSTVAAQLVIDTLDKSPNTITILVPVKNLKLKSRFSVRELIQFVNDFLVNEVVNHSQNINLVELLGDHIEILIVFDGLDELSQEIASRLLRIAAHLTENWPTIQVVATARPIELQGVSFANWKVIHTTSLSDEKQQQFIQEELVADGLEPEKAKQKSEILVKKLKDQPELNSLASTPLTIRLIYPHLKNATPNKSNTLGDLLYELLLMRLEDWQKRDDKPSNFDYFESIFPTAEAKMEYFSTLTMKAMEKPGISIDEAKAIFLDKDEIYNAAKKHLLVKEALSYFEWLGLITITDVIDFPLQSLAEMSAATGLLREWKSQTTNIELPSNSQWRVVSFLATVARRRGQLEKVSQPLHKYIQQLLVPSTPSLPAACYIVTESNDSLCAKVAIESFCKLERRPLTFFGDEQITSARNIAMTIWLADKEGFDWLYSHYLDPQYPIINAGSRVIQDVFKQWAAIAFTHLNTNQKQRLSKLVNPYLATEGGSFFGVLDILSVLVPEAFEQSDCLWYQSHSLDSPLFGEWVFSQFEIVSRQNQVILEKVLLPQLASSKKAAFLWLKLNPDEEPPIPLIQHALRLIKLNTSYDKTITEECINRLGQEKWMHFVRWFLFGSDRSVATGATIVLYQKGEQHLSILGDTLIDSLHDGGYQAHAENILLSLVKKAGDKGVRWLAFRISNCSEHYGAHSGLWRIFLAQVNHANDGPILLAGCVHKLGEFVLPRYPEVREAFSQLFNSSKGEDYKVSLRKQLHSLDPMVREGAAKILISANPHTEGEALFVAVRSRANRNNHRDQHEWEKFCLSLSFSPSVLTLLQSRLHLLDPNSRTFALFLLVKNSIEIQGAQCIELKSNLLTLDNWHLTRDPVGKSLLSTQESFTYLLSILDEPTSKGAERAAEHLLELHSKKLSLKDKAKCTALSNKFYGWPHDLVKLMVKITSDDQFADVFIKASQEIKIKGGNTSVLEIVLNASKGEVSWKNVLWPMLCDDTSFGGSSESETSGSALLEYGLIMSQHSKAIGAAAVECLSDPRVKNNRWTDAYHWLAVIADEFVGLAEVQIESILKKSASTIRAEATTSLLARLGYVPEGIEFRRGHRNRPNLSTDEIDQKNEISSIIQKLNDFSHDSDSLHPDIIPLIEQSLYFPPFDNQVMTNFRAYGKPGMLISTTLRHCYGYSPQLFETIPLLDHWGVTNNTNDQTKKKLQGIWRTIRSSVHDSDEEISRKYLKELDKQLFSSNTWELFIAFEILQVRGYLLETQIEPMFIKYINHTSYLHVYIFEELIRWLSSELDESTKQAVISATHAALIILNENTLFSSYGDDSKEWVFSIFPVIQWVLEGKQTLAAYTGDGEHRFWPS